MSVKQFGELFHEQPERRCNCQLKAGYARGLLILVLLSGCSSHIKEEFDCPPGKGLGCQSITEVKKKLNQGQISLPETTTEAYRRGGSSTGSPLVMDKTVIPFSGEMTSTSLVDSNGVVIQRTPEKLLRVWIAPHQDQDGNLREASIAYTIVRPGYWQMNPSSQDIGITSLGTPIDGDAQ
jgi:conjugal transfer pilus assembly protein TraV